MIQLPAVPPLFKPCQTYMKLALDHETIDPTVTYWCRLYVFQIGLKIDTKEKENKAFLSAVMSWLEDEKKKRSKDETITNEVVAQAHIENYGIKIFEKADYEDRAGKATKTTAKLFFTASQIFDLLAVFGKTDEEITQKSRYSKWRAAYITKCLKSGEPILPPEEEKKEDKSNEDSTLENQNENQTDLDKLNLNNDQPAKIGNPLIQSSKEDHSDDGDDSYEATTLYASNGNKLTPKDIVDAKKFCKWGMSALDYDDIQTAATNLNKALNILTNGGEN